jgi:glutamate-1-semialdehyde 2,1-aminomutase
MMIIEEYARKHPRSRELYEEAKGLFPSGVTHDTRYVHPFPLFMTNGKGARKWDVDGNEYVCCVMGHGALILGHGHPEIVRAVQEQMERGTHLGSSTESELRWARAVKRLIPAIEKIRFHSSGTEATLMAIRLARAFTGKPRILMFNDHFHGWSDCVIPETGKWSSGGITPATFQTSLRVPAGDIGAFDKALKENSDIAAVMLEPTGASMGCYPLRPAFVREVRELTAALGILLIFDEVVTGFRVSPGGAQEKLGVRPDLTALAKICAGGLPGGAVGGRGDVMDMIAFHDDPRWDAGRRVSHPGTYNANPLSAAAGARCLELIAERPVNRTADDAALRLASGLNRVLGKMGVPGIAYRSASIVWVLFGLSPGELKRCSDVEGEDEGFLPLPHGRIKEAVSSQTAQIFKRALLNTGVDIMGSSEFILSAAHDDNVIDDIVEAFERAVASMKEERVI